MSDDMLSSYAETHADTYSLEPGDLGLEFMEAGGKISSPADQMAYALSGGSKPGRRVRFTLRNLKTGRHITYQVKTARGPIAAGEGRRRFVSVLTGPCNEESYSYLGVIFDKPGRGVHWPGGLSPPGSWPTVWTRTVRFHLLKGSFVWTSNPYYQGKKSKIGKDAPSALGFRFLWAYLVGGTPMPASVEFWHQGSCGRCGRTLTDPESIARGLGPVCVGK